MKRVVVLMSTYNGEKYLREQIESILNQKEVEVFLMVRDDGSYDNTLEILHEYESENVFIYKGNNIGPAKSFLEMIIKAPECEYYAFSDQDDIWCEDKLINAIKRLEKVKGVALCIGAYKRVDENLKDIDDCFIRQENYSLEETIVYRAPLGCTMVFNRELKEILQVGVPSNVRMHDHWVIMLAESLNGYLLYEESSRILYRQHSGNVVGIGASFFKRVRRLVKSCFFNTNERQLQASAMLKQYETLLSNDKKEILQMVRDYKKSLKNRVRLAFDYRFKKIKISKRLLFMISVLLGVF